MPLTDKKKRSWSFPTENFQTSYPKHIFIFSFGLSKLLQEFYLLWNKKLCDVAFRHCLVHFRLLNMISHLCYLETIMDSHNTLQWNWKKLITTQSLKWLVPVSSHKFTTLREPFMWLWYFSSSVNSSNRARCLIFSRTLRILPYFMCANSKGSGETVWMRRLAWAFAGRLCDKYHNLMSWLKGFWMGGCKNGCCGQQVATWKWMQTCWTVIIFHWRRSNAL